MASTHLILNKVENVREEMNNAEAHEVLMPMVQPKDLWNESKRWDKFVQNCLDLKIVTIEIFA